MIREEGEKEKKKEKGVTGQKKRMRSQQESCCGLALSGLRGSKLIWEFCTLSWLADTFFSSAPLPRHPPLPSHQTLACVLFRTGIKASTLNLLSGFVEIGLQVVEGLQKLPLRRSQFVGRWFAVWKVNSAMATPCICRFFLG